MRLPKGKFRLLLVLSKNISGVVVKEMMGECVRIFDDVREICGGFAFDDECPFVLIRSDQQRNACGAASFRLCYITIAI